MLSCSLLLSFSVGPTNSGKTFFALKRLKEVESGIYCGERLIPCAVLKSLITYSLITYCSWLCAGLQRLLLLYWLLLLDIDWTSRSHFCFPSRSSLHCCSGPLRLLAWEVHEKLVADGVPCDLLTGQEQVHIDGAAHVACTIEMANFVSASPRTALFHCLRIR